MGFAKSLHQAPFYRFVVPFIIGIVVGINYNISVPSILILSVIVIIIIVCYSFRVFASYRINYLFGLLLTIFFVISGISIINTSKSKLVKLEPKLYTSIAYLTSEPLETENSIKAFGKIMCIKDSLDYKQVNAKILLYFKKDSNSKKLNIGDQLVINSYLNDIRHNGNPNAFNYKKYLSYKQIQYQTFIKSGKWRLINSNIGNSIYLSSNKIRKKLFSIYQKYGIRGEELAVLSALTLGYKNDLSDELKQSYSNSGAMHILAVSGLHVGIIFIILNSLLFFLEKNLLSKIIKVTIVISFLAFYTLLTGMSSSVLRAFIMFTCLSVGKLLNRQNNIYNTLAVSAFLILTFNPYAIMDVGFQLSYTAVLSIVFFQSRIYSLINVDNYFGNKIWELLSVSIAAQIGTFPIAIYYFHQFPNYFWLTNIFIIPAATIIIGLSVVLLSVSWINSLSIIIAKVISTIIFLLNLIITTIEKLPYSVSDNIFISLQENIIYYIIIITISAYLVLKKTKYLKFSLLLIIVLLVFKIYDNSMSIKQNKIVVYNISKTTAIDFIYGRSNKLYTVSNDTNKLKKSIKYNISNYWGNCNIDNTNICIYDNSIKNSRLDTGAEIAIYNKFIYFKGKRVLILDNNDYYNKKSENKIYVDILIISNNAKIKPEELVTMFYFSNLVFDSSISYWKLESWKKYCKNNNLPFYDVQASGAFIYKIN